jgi:hypothetical protein
VSSQVFLWIGKQADIHWEMRRKRAVVQHFVQQFGLAFI